MVLYSVSFWYDLSDCSPGGGVFVVQPLADSMANAINAMPDFGKRRRQGAEAEAQIVGLAEVRDNLHFGNQGLVDLIAQGVANTDMRATDERITGAAHGKAEVSQMRIKQGNHVFGDGHRFGPNR